MRVRLLHIDQNTGSESFEAECDHTECFPDDQESADAALQDLKRVGRHYTGGGAAPLFLLMAANPKGE